jgi:hypothetical protein
MDRNAEDRDSLDPSRQNNYHGSSVYEFSVTDAMRITGYARVTVNLICRQLNIGKKVGRPRILCADDLDKIASWRKESRLKQQGDGVNMSKQSIRPLGLDPLVYKLFTANRDYTEKLEKALRYQSDRIWDMRKSMAILADDLEQVKARLDKLKPKEGRSGRGVSILGRTAPLTPYTHEAEAA